MDSVQTVTDVETPAETVAGVVGTPETEEEAQLQANTSEMGELPVEDWDYQRPRRGEVRTGVILAIDDQEIIVDVGVKRDGLVPYADMQRLGPEALAEFSVGDEVPVYVLRPEDKEGNLLVSLYMARQTQAWTRAQELADSGEVWEEQVIGFNKGGLVVPVDEIRGFVPASQVPGFPHGLSQEERLDRLSKMVGETLQVKVIEINRRKRRLILSATAAQQLWRKKQREKLLEELREGEVRKGVVSSLCNFGAFVDLGGADGLVHISELSWRRIRHPREVLREGQEVEVYVLRLDHERKRIGLSLKRLQPEPWSLVEDKYELGQLVEGVVTNVVDFGAFAEIEAGVEGLIHVSELSEAKISHPRDVVKKGDLLLLRIIRIDTRRKRLGLSLKRVLESEWAEWAAELAVAEAEKEAEAEVEEVEAEVEAGVEEIEAEAEAVVEAEVEEIEAEAEAEVEAEVEEVEAEAEAEVEAEVEEVEAEAEAEVEAEVEELEAEAEAEVKAEVEEVEAEAEAEVEAEVEEVEAEAEVEAEVEEIEAEAEAAVEAEVEEIEAEAEAAVEAEVEEIEAEAEAVVEAEVEEVEAEAEAVVEAEVEELEAEADAVVEAEVEEVEAEAEAVVEAEVEEVEAEAEAVVEAAVEEVEAEAEEALETEAAAEAAEELVAEAEAEAAAEEETEAEGEEELQAAAEVVEELDAEGETEAVAEEDAEGSAEESAEATSEQAAPDEAEAPSVQDPEPAMVEA